MLEFKGTYFDGRSSLAHPVDVSFVGGLVEVRSEDGDLLESTKLEACTVEPPLGRTARSLSFPGGGRLDTTDHAAFERLEEARGGNGGLRLVHWLESHWHLTILCLVALLVFTWGFSAYGIPMLATQAAYATPRGVLDGVSARTLEVLDKRFFEPSTLETERMRDLRQGFSEIVQDLGTGYAYRLEFRRSPSLGANAFALPSGIIVMTDELVDLAESDAEVLGVLAHEVAHVEKRHGLRSLYQNAGVFLLISALVGDVASITSVAASLPTFLVESSYSRRFEREADEVAARYFIEQDLGTAPFRAILERLSQEGLDVPAFLSSHPGTEERIRYLEELETSEK